ncbi:hypothetical protein PC9H_002845 [Pleurotus ostreatus]|uniref:Alcohol acetyltransferase n=1 Tax=Pleurotus ostreatus TaxID=5322 RepID=A0A8H7A0B4_PLEOS|nr:uncharacterized protein PC9H_002845 [Pleurotus ostreatus]KAF7436019.1 hypothetical protein PC9H_002845 [Pleurotus ostreatus]KAJ8688816.1 hypothetical protein PTI98_013561 [Pleurotus ostreatus]
MEEVTPAAQIIRPAGLLERLHISRQRLGLGATVLVAAKFVASNSSQERSLHRDEFHDAVVEAIDQHPALAVRIHNEVETTGPPSLMRMSAVDLDQGIQFLTSEQSSKGFQAVVEDALVTQFDSSTENSPMWRFTVLPDNHVIFLYHHVLGDGQSGLGVLQTVVQALNKAAGASTTVVRERFYIPRQKLELLPPIEERTNCDITLRTFFHAIIDELLPSWTKNKVWTGNPVLPAVPTPPGRVATRVRIVSLPPDAASRLLTQARSHQTTITSIIHVSAILALSHLLTEPHVSSKTPSDTGDSKEVHHTNANSKYEKIKSHTAVSLRSFANVPSTTMYETASAHDHSETIVSTRLPFPCCASAAPQSWKDDFPWSKASRISKDLKKGGPYARSKLGLLKFLDGKFEGYWAGKLGKKRDESLELSNVGSWSLQTSAQPNGIQDGQSNEKDESENTKWGVLSAYFAQDDNVVGSAMKVNVIGSPNGELNVCVTWGEGAVDDQLAEAFAGGLRHGLEQLSSASP